MVLSSKKNIKRIIVFVLSILAVLLVLFASLTLYVYTSYANGSLKKTLSNSLGVPISFKVKGVGLSGLSPVLYLKDVKVAPQQIATKNVFHLKAMSIKLAVWESIFHLSLVSSKIKLTGLDLKLQQGKNGKFTLLGDQSKSTTKLSWAGIWKFLAPQQDIALDNANLYIKRPGNANWSLYGLSLHWQQLKDAQYSLTLSSNIPQLGHASINLMAILSGNLAKLSTVNAKLYSVVSTAKITPFLQDLSYRGLSLKQGNGNAQVWATVLHGKLQQLQTKVLLNKLQLFNKRLGHSVSFKLLLDNVLWQRTKDGFYLSVQPLYLGSQINNNYFSLNKSKNIWQLRVGRFDLVKLNYLLSVINGVPKPLNIALAQLKPSGYISNVYTSFVWKNKQLEHLVVDSHFANVALKSYKNAPQIKGLSGDLHLTNTWGTASISADQVVLGKDKIFLKTWPALSLKANLAWQKTHGHWQLAIKSFHAANQNLKVYARSILTFKPNSFANPHINLDAGIVLKHGHKMLKFYLPIPLMSKDLSDWLLKCTVSAPVTYSSFIWRGYLDAMPYKSHTGNLEIYSRIPSGKLIPWYSWPVFTNIHGSLLFHNASFLGTAQSAKVIGGSVNKVTVAVADMQKGVPADLVIKGNGLASGKGAEEFIEVSPIRESLGRIFKVVSIKKALKLHMQLHFPLQHDAHNKVFGNVVLHDNTAIVHGLNVPITDLTGKISFVKMALFSHGVTGRLWGRPVKITINTKGVPDYPASLETNTKVTGTINTKILSSHFKLPLANNIRGISSFNVLITTQSASTKVLFTSSLSGVAFNFPAPFYKQTSTRFPFKLQLNFNADSKNVPLQFSLGDMASAKLLFLQQDKGFKLLFGNINLGSSQVPQLKKIKGLHVSGSIPFVSAAAWQAKVMPFLQQHGLTTGNSSSSILKSINLRVGQLQIYKQAFHNAKISIVWQKPNWIFSVDSKKAKGYVILPHTKGAAYSAKFARLFLTKSKNLKDTNLNLNDLITWPSINLNAADLHYGKYNFGSVQIGFKPISRGIEFNNLKINNKNLTADLSGSWFDTSKNPVVMLDGSIVGKNWGNALASVGYAGFMTKGTGPLVFALNWQGGLLSPKLASLNGKLEFDLKKGSLSKVNPGVSRFIGLFSLESLSRRLSFNFSDMTDKGLAFDVLKGDYKINAGIASTKYVYMSGPALELILKGYINLAKKTLDQKVVVIPHVNGGLAIAATIIGGPIAGAATWVADKILSSTILKGKGLVYELKGPWNKPTLKKLD